MQNKQKAVKIINIVVTVICAIIVLFSIVLVISALTSKSKGYTSIFGYAYTPVLTNSMEGSNEDSFSEGDIIYIKLLSDSEKSALKENDIIAFWGNVQGDRELIAHRIVEVLDIDGITLFRTKGDNNDVADGTLRTFEDVQGIYKGKSNGIGEALIWLQTRTGFLVCVVIPCILVVIYCAVMVIISAVDYNKKKIALAKEEVKDELTEEMREKLKEELKRELMAENKAANPDNIEE